VKKHCKKAIRKQTNHDYLRLMMAICLHPYYKISSPILIQIFVNHKDRIEIGIDKLKPYLSKLDSSYPYDCDYYCFINNNLKKYFVNDIIDEVKAIVDNNDFMAKLAAYNVPESISSIEIFYDAVQHCFNNFLAAIAEIEQTCSEEFLINAEEYLMVIKQSKFA
jgi:hypothetical protein